MKSLALLIYFHLCRPALHLNSSLWDLMILAPPNLLFLKLIFNCFLAQSSIDQAIWEGGRELNERLDGGVRPLDPLHAPPLAQAASLGSLSSIASLGVLLLGRVSTWISLSVRWGMKLSSKDHYGKLPPVL